MSGIVFGAFSFSIYLAKTEFVYILNILKEDVQSLIVKIDHLLPAKKRK